MRDPAERPPEKSGTTCEERLERRRSNAQLAVSIGILLVSILGILIGL
jgi:hypothetical protein